MEKFYQQEVLGKKGWGCDETCPSSLNKLTGHVAVADLRVLLTIPGPARHLPVGGSMTNTTALFAHRDNQSNHGNLTTIWPRRKPTVFTYDFSLHPFYDLVGESVY
ncbi:hypothetical protein RRG08_031489 [Elysia crispata]|uniref:Uncharacterized protein n=1 Tax=Elysia crispata TaxID=231223 RepID=A0AAE1DJ73_9GAST|nr:hypothetical protein RRG08_031489 [Elysia crispata]